MASGKPPRDPEEAQILLDLLIDFGYDSYTALKIAADARRHLFTSDDVAAWIDHAISSKTLANPRGFVRARIRDGHTPPRPLDPLRQEHAARQRYASWGICPKCSSRPCMCNWDREKETLAQYRQRTYPDPAKENHANTS